MEDDAVAGLDISLYYYKKYFIFPHLILIQWLIMKQAIRDNLDILVSELDDDGPRRTRTSKKRIFMSLGIRKMI